MKRRLPVTSADLRGSVRLATEATAGLTDLVEAMHERIARLPGFGVTPPDGRSDGRTGGLTGLVYKTIRGVTRVAGGSVEALLGLAAAALGPDATDVQDDAVTQAPSPQREALVSALNGVLGDHLVATANPLAITMAFRQAGVALPLERDALAARLPQAGPRLLVLLHGLCMNDLQWLRDGHDHGAALARAEGWTPVYLHYNSGRPIADNGAGLAGLLQRLLDAWPQPVQGLALLGHSMGGLVARSALHHARQAGLPWARRVDDLVCLGTPHHGAPLERAGHGVDLLLAATPYTAPLARLGRVRSAGITDLRHGRIAPAGQPPVPLPTGVRCHALAGTLGLSAGDLKDRLLGDGLVPLDSALGRHADPARDLGFPVDHCWVGAGIGHLDLLSSPAVFEALRRTLQDPGPR